MEVYDVFADKYIDESEKDPIAPPERYEPISEELLIKNAARWLCDALANIEIIEEEKTSQNEADRIQNAINHIKTSVDIDPWAMEIAVEAMRKQIPKQTVKPDLPYFKYACPSCGNYPLSGLYCGECGQRIVYCKEGEG